jgi:putative nucleotidyltransferase with HDIG domain
MINKEDCLILLEKHLGEEKRIIDHSKTVNKVALHIAWELNNAGIPIDIALVDGGSLLHDIGKIREIKSSNSLSHAEEGYKILMDEELEDFANIVRKHLFYSFRNPMLRPRNWEEKILFYADMLVKEGDAEGGKKYRLVPFTERLDYLRKVYGKNKEILEAIDESENLLYAIETQLIERIGDGYTKKLEEEVNLV